MPEVDFHDYFYYDETSPSFLRWKHTVLSGNGNSLVVRLADSVAGSLNKSTGYYIVSLQYKRYRVHRVVYVMFNGNISELSCIDHKDRNKTNNSPSNLRCVTKAVNSRNCKMNERNSSGVNGVSVQSRGGIIVGWRARWSTLDGVKLCKQFTFKMYGTDAFYLACAYRKKMIDSLTSEGADYSESHGLADN